MPEDKAKEEEQELQIENEESAETPVEFVEAEVIADEELAAEEIGQEKSEVEILKEELAQVQAKADENLDGWQRSAADFANYKRRVTREQAQNQQRATANAIIKYLEIFDDLDRAIKNRPQTGEVSSWTEGIELVYRKFQAFLEAEGVEMIDSEGQEFDPNLHEAISQEDNPDFDSGQIIGVVQQGYRMGDRILRPARVRVAR
jgi:molecular chaperone GrpE